MQLQMTRIIDLVIMFSDAPEDTVSMAICSATNPIDRLDVVLAPAQTLTQAANTTRGKRRNMPGPNFANIGISTYVRR